MSDYFDVGSFKKKKAGGAYFVRLGSAKPRDDGGFTCWLDAMPSPGESGQYEIQIVPQRERGAQTKTPAQANHGEEDREPLPF